MAYIPYETFMSQMNGRMEDMEKHPWKYYVKPFRIIGNVWYVGDKMVCIHLIDTGDGLILIDTGYPSNKYMLIQSIWEAGFNPANIRYIVHTHEHYDHFGATADLVGMYGCKTVISSTGAEVMKNHPERILMENQYSYMEAFQPDILVNDGDTLTLGTTTLKFLLTPGHAEGVVTILFDTQEAGKTYHLALFGGATTVTMYTRHLKCYGIRESIWNDFIESLDRLQAFPVDVVLGNHPRQNDTLGKLSRLLAGEPNPFIDNTEWQTFLTSTKANFLAWAQEDLAWEKANAAEQTE